MLTAASAAVLSPGILACSTTDARQDAAIAQRSPVFLATGEAGPPLQELVRLAALAPSSHNTQCWRFEIRPKSIVIAPDLARRCPAVDPDDHHLFASLGCAAENMVHAALAHGLQADVRFDPAGDGAIEVGLASTRAVASPLFRAIAQRQCTRGDYDGQPIRTDELALLERAGTGRGVRIVLLTAAPERERILEYVVAANTTQMSDPAFVAELKAWIRFSAAEALQRGDGLFAALAGNPTMPRWLGSRLMGLFFTPGSENRRYAAQVRSSAGIAVFVSESSDRAHWIEAGRCYERFALQATALGIRNAFINQPVEVGAVRPQFATAFGLGEGRPDLVVRFGRGPVMPLSLRRPVEAVLQPVGASFIRARPG
jgi:hypothetical protein